MKLESSIIIAITAACALSSCKHHKSSGSPAHKTQGTIDISFNVLDTNSKIIQHKSSSTPLDIQFDITDKTTDKQETINESQPGQAKSFKYPVGDTIVITGQTASIYYQNIKSYLASQNPVTIKISKQNPAIVFSYKNIANSNIATLTNASNYILTINTVSADSSEAGCIGEANDASCKKVLIPGQAQEIYLPSGGGINLNYFISSPGQSNFNLNLQHWGEAAIQSGSNAGNAPNTTLVVDSPNFTLKTTTPITIHPQTYSAMPLRGINLSGAETGDQLDPAAFPSIADAIGQNYPNPSFNFIAAGMNTVRYPINWNYITTTPDKNAANTNILHQNMTGTEYLESVHAMVQKLLNSGLNVILDLHDYMRFAAGQKAGDGDVVTTGDMQKIWTLLADKFNDLATQYPNQSTHPNQLIFGIMNEPHDMQTQQVVDNDNAGIAAIRNQGLSNLILVEGNGWSGLHSWNDSAVGTDSKSNANLMNEIIDQDNNYAIDVHQYFDSNGSGTHPECQPLTNFQTYLHWADFKAWVNKYKVKVFLSEFGSPSNGSNCASDANYLLSQIAGLQYTDSTGGFIGWTTWFTSHSWTGLLSMQPASDPTQMHNIYAKQLTAIAAK